MRNFRNIFHPYKNLIRLNRFPYSVTGIVSLWVMKIFKFNMIIGLIISEIIVCD